MFFPLSWALIALASQTRQVAASISEYSLSYNDSLAPHLLNLRFNLRRQLRNKNNVDKRAYIFDKHVRNDRFCYLIDFKMGSPPQHIEAELNPKYGGTYLVTLLRSDLFMPVRVSHRVRHDKTLTPARSKTYRRLSYFTETSSKFYGTSWGAYAEDNLFFDVEVFEHFKFILLQHSPEPAMIGLGLLGSSNHVIANTSQEDSTNIFCQMKKKGWSLMSLYSIWIGSEGSDASGMIVFNGVDQRYIFGDIYIFPLLKLGDKHGYYIKLDAINYLRPDGSIVPVAKISMALELDFTKVYSSFPQEIMELFYADFVVYEGYVHKVPCEIEMQKGAIGLVFSGIQFAFPFSSILPDCQRGEEMGSPPFHAGTRSVLGANFLSALYMVFDLDNEEVGLALARTDSGVETIQRNYSFVYPTIKGTKAPYYSNTRYFNTYEMVFEG